jgi:hypothetical protein
MSQDPTKDVDRLLRLMPGEEAPGVPEVPGGPVREGSAIIKVISDDSMYFKTKAGFMEAGDPPVQALCSVCGSMFYVPASYDPSDPECELRCRICGRVQPREASGLE